MSNIHGFGGVRDPENNQRGGASTRRQMFVLPMSEFYINPEEVPKRNFMNPEKETFPQMLRNNVCPVFRIKSALGVFMIVMTVVFILQRIIDRLLIPGNFLMVNPKGPYSSHMSLKYKEIASGQIWRLFTGSIGWIDLGQWFSILIFALFFMTNIQYVLGIKRCISKFFYFHFYILSFFIIQKK